MKKNNLSAIFLIITAAATAHAGTGAYDEIISQIMTNNPLA